MQARCSPCTRDIPPTRPISRPGAVRRPSSRAPNSFRRSRTSIKQRWITKARWCKAASTAIKLGDAVRELAFRRKIKLSDTVLFPFPHPKAVGLNLDPKEMATVLKVEPGTAAEEAGFIAGDAIRTLAGQPLLSIADVQWALNSAPPEGAMLKAEVTRQCKPVQITLALKCGMAASARTTSPGERALRACAARPLAACSLSLFPTTNAPKWKLPGSIDRLARAARVGQFCAARFGQSRPASAKARTSSSASMAAPICSRETDIIAYSLREPSNPANAWS